MSSVTERKARCPHCGADTLVRQWSSINTEIDPESKRLIFSGELLLQHCAICRRSFHTLYDFLYHDPTKELMVWVKHHEKTTTGAAEFAALDGVGKMLVSYKLRIVSSVGQLNDKISVFDSGFDDRVIEFLKQVYWKQLYPGRPYDDDFFFYVGIQEHDGQSKLAFHHYSINRSAGAVAAPLAAYNNIAPKIQNLLPPLTPGQWHTINGRYIVEAKRESARKSKDTA